MSEQKTSKIPDDYWIRLTHYLEARYPELKELKQETVNHQV